MRQMNTLRNALKWNNIPREGKFDPTKLWGQTATNLLARLLEEKYGKAQVNEKKSSVNVITGCLGFAVERSGCKGMINKWLDSLSFQYKTLNLPIEEAEVLCIKGYYKTGFFVIFNNKLTTFAIVYIKDIVDYYNQQKGKALKTIPCDHNGKYILRDMIDTPLRFVKFIDVDNKEELYKFIDSKI